MANTKVTQITLIASILILGALASKEYNGTTLNRENVKIVVEDAQSPTIWSMLLSCFSFDYLKDTLLGNLNFDISDLSFNPIGLVLLLGSLSVNYVIGSLTHNGWAEYLPIFSSHVVATNKIVEPLSGHTLYNITDKIQALDVSGWFSRFLATQDLGYISTTIALKRTKPNKSASDVKDSKDLLAGLLAFLTFGVLSRAAYHSENGFATINVWSILGLVVCRRISIEQLRLGVDKMVKEALPKQKDTDKQSGYSMHDVCKVWLTMPTGNAVQIIAPRGLVRCLLMTPKPGSPKVYTVVQCISGVLFAIQALTLGLTSTAYQVTCLSALALSTVLLINKTTLINCKTAITTTIGRELELTVRNNDKAGKHMNVYANMALKKDDEESMRLWGLMPHASNKVWWTDYQALKEEEEAVNLVEPMD